MKAGVLAFNDGIISDHRGLFCNIHHHRLLWRDILQIRKRTPWRLRTKYKNGAKIQ